MRARVRLKGVLAGSGGTYRNSSDINFISGHDVAMELCVDLVYP